MLREFLRWSLLISLAIFLAAPFVWMVLISLHPAGSPLPELNQIWPKEFSWTNYPFVLFQPEIPVFRFFFNTMLVTGAVVNGQLLVSSLAAYSLSRLQWKGRDWVFGLFLASMMFAGTVTQIPVYLMIQGLGWLDTYAALIVPGLSSAFSIFLLRQFFLQLPLELDEAARLDGASELKIWWKIILPLSKASLSTAGAFTFFAVWTDFFWPLLATNSVRMRTLEVGLSIFKNSYGGTNWPLQMTASVIILMPLIVVFIAVQGRFVRGVTLGSLK